MTRRPSTPSKLGALATAGLAALLVQRLLVGSTTSFQITQVGVVALALWAAAVMWWRSSFEARLAAVVVAVATGLGTLLSLTIGLPGSRSTDLAPVPFLMIVLSVLIPVTVVLDVRAGRLARDRDRRPYAL